MTGVTVLQMFVHRYRRLYVGMLAYLVVLAGLAQLPSGTIPNAAIGSLLAPFFLGLFASIAAFANPDTDLAAETSGYPAFLLRLPVKSVTLAFWPLVGVSLWGAFLWFGLAKMYLLPSGMTVPIIWPMLLIAATGMTLQATLWMPFRAGAIRLMLAILIPAALVIFGAWAQANNLPQAQISFVFAVEGVLAAAWAGYAVKRARVTGAMRSAIRERTYTDKSRRLSPFRTPAMAQFWLEWRKEGRLLPMITALILGAGSVPLLWERVRYQVVYRGDLNVNTWVWSMMPSLPWLTLIIATILGMGASKSYMRSPEGSYHLFFATRPLSSAQMLKAKYTSITLGVVTAWAITILVAAGWLMLPADDLKGHEAPLLSLLLQRTPWEEAAAMAGGALLLGFWAVRNQIVGVFTHYAPVPSIRGIYAMAVAISAGGISVLLGTSGRFFGEAKNAPIVAGLLGFVLLVKVGLAFWLGSKVISVRPGERKRVVTAFLIWPVWGGLFAAAAMWATAWHRDDNVLFMTPIPILAAFLLVPLVRPMAAKLSIEKGRHR